MDVTPGADDNQRVPNPKSKDSNAHVNPRTITISQTGKDMWQLRLIWCRRDPEESFHHDEFLMIRSSAKEALDTRRALYQAITHGEIPNVDNSEALERKYVVRK